MIVGIIGSRRRDTLRDLGATRRVFDEVAATVQVTGIVSGGCPKGGDRFAEILARRHSIPITIHRANWKKFGRAAGFIRNTDIAADSEILIAVVHKDRMGGTEDTIRKFLMMGKGAVFLVEES